LQGSYQDFEGDSRFGAVSIIRLRGKGGAQKSCGSGICHPGKGRHQKKAARNSRLLPGEGL